MSPNDRSILHVTEDAFGEIAPTSAMLHVLLTSDRFFSGRAALERAEEIKRLVVSLMARGIPDDAVALEGASLDVSSGLFTKSSSVTYRLRVHVRDVDRVGDALDAVADCKKATLTNLTWDYAGASAGTKLLEECAARAMARAKALAGALGVAIEGVHAVREQEIGEAAPMMPMGGAPMMAMRARGSIASEIGGLELAPKKKVGVRVELDCRLAR
jgi:uncharacterized protein YggE